ncbi:MAG: cobalamin-dependent protein [Clostridia bacterium]|nr:cobalamin-dependent protein [Clostridia bacterium]
MVRPEEIGNPPSAWDVPQSPDVHISESSYRHGTTEPCTYTQSCMEISMVTSGSGIHKILDREIPCKEGDIYIIYPDITHGFLCSEGSEPLRVRHLCFRVEHWFDGNTASYGDPRFCYGIFNDDTVTAYAMLNQETKQKVCSFFNLIEEETDKKETEWQDAVRSYLSLLLITVGRYVNSAIKSLPSLPPKEWSVVSAALQTVRDRFHESDLTLESIADTLYISKSYLSRLFKRLTGNGFSEHLRNVRLLHSCKLLEETDLTVEEIMKQCGLRDTPSFYHNFNAYTGMTPHQYRTFYTQDNCKKQKGELIMSILNEISENLQRGKAKIVKELVEKALAEGCAPADILNEGLLSGMNVIGEKFKNNEVYVPEVLVAARAMNMGTQVLKPHLAAEGIAAKGKVCIGTVQGDLHDIGKNLVKMMLEGKGLEVVDLGTDVSPETFVKTAIEENCQIICCSALLTTTMGVMADVVKAAEEAGIRDKVKIMIGGAPVSEDFCKKIGADCYTSDAASAADAAVELCKG